MNIYTKHGDRGTTSLANGMSVSKSDDRIELLGTIDELNSHIGLAKVLADASLKERLSHIQRNLMQIMAGVADPRNLDYRFSQDETSALEEEIDQIENSFPRVKEFVLYGGCELSARLDVARAVARRSERRFRKVEQNYGADARAMQYVNRLSDYLYMCARYADYRVQNEKNDQIQDQVVRNIMKGL